MQTPPSAHRHIRLRRLPSAGNRTRCLRGTEGPHHHARPRLKKTICGACGTVHRSWYDKKVRQVRDLSCGDTRVWLELEVRRVRCRKCATVKRERLDFLADNPLYTKRFAWYVGRRCRTASIKAVADELHLDWHTVKELEKHMHTQLVRAGTPGPKVIGIDEVSIRKGHTYRIVVSDLLRGRPIWFGGTDRSKASMDEFYTWLGERKTKGIRLAVMDMWKPFRNSNAQHAPQAAILFDKFHIIRHLGEALDKVRKQEYARLSAEKRKFIKGQKYNLLSRRENLTLDGRQALKALLAANKRLKHRVKSPLWARSPGGGLLVGVYGF
ncbi:MAG: ISL3 family transposase [Chromatiales bacterium]